MPIPGHIWSPRAKGDVRAAFAERARQDWEGFLRHRAVEMVPGGCLVVIGGASDDEGDSGADALMDLANEVLRDLVSEGTLAEAQYDAMTIPTYNRTPREFMAPFADGKPFNGLALERQALKVVPDALWESYRQSGNVDAFAASYVSFFRAAFGPSLFGAAGSPSGGSGAVGLEAQFADRLAKKIAAEPARAVTRWRVFAMLIRKAGG